MIPSKPAATKTPRHFTAFRSAAEEAAATKADQESWDNEGGHMSSTCGRIAQTSDSELPYKVILTHDRGEDTERAFATMREAEAFIRCSTPVPAARRTLYDRDAPEI